MMKKELLRPLGMILVIFLLIIKEGFGQHQKGQLINVKAFKAVGDGTTDDTAAIQEAISKAAAGDTVLIPAGTYLVRSLGLKSGINMKGEGMLIQRIEGEKEGVTNDKQNSSMPL